MTTTEEEPEQMLVIPDDLESIDVDDEAQDEDRTWRPVESLQDAAYRLQDLKDEKADLEAEILFVESWIDNAVKESDYVPYGRDEEGHEVRLKVTPVRSYTTKADMAVMREVAPELAKKVIKVETTEKVDTDLLVKAIEKGEVTVEAMTKFVTRTPKKTSIRLTQSVVRDDDDQEGDS